MGGGEGGGSLCGGGGVTMTEFHPSFAITIKAETKWNKETMSCQ